MKKAVERANRENTPKVIVLGEEEITQNMYIIKDMKSGEEEMKAFISVRAYSHSFGYMLFCICR